MNEKLASIGIVLFVLLTAVTLIVGGLDLFDDRPPSAIEDPADDEKPKTLEEKQEDERKEQVAPATVAVEATWELLELTRAEPKEQLIAPLPKERIAQKLPRLEGRLIVRTPESTGGVRSVRRVEGGRIVFEQKAHTVSSAMFGFKADGRDARVIAITLNTGERLLRLLTPETLAKASPVVFVTEPGTLRGRVLDRTNQPIRDAAIEVDGRRAMTDFDGRFAISGVRGPRAIGYVKMPGYAIRRVEFDTPRSFGKPRAPEYEAQITLHPATSLTIRMAPDAVANEPFFVYLIPFGYQLADRELAVEKMGPIKVGPGGAVTFPHLPIDQQCVAIAVSPAHSFVTERLAASKEERSFVIDARPWRKVTGDVTAAGAKERLRRFDIESSLAGVELGEYLAAIKAMPSGHRSCSYPLPLLTGRLYRRSVEADRSYEVAFDANVLPTIRFKAPGYRARTFEDVKNERLDVLMSPLINAGPETAQVTLKLAFAGTPRIESFRCEQAPGAEHEQMGPHLMVFMKDVAPGRYKLTVRAPHYATYHRTVVISGGSQRQLPAFISLD